MGIFVFFCLSNAIHCMTKYKITCSVSTLLNRPPVDPPPSLIQAASEAMVDSSIPIDPPSISETYKAIRKIKAGKASGICSIHPEYIHHASGEAMRYLTNLFCTIWETETVPEEWHQGIIIPLYKDKGSRSDCRSYRGITLLWVPGKAFSHVLLARIRPVLLCASKTTTEWVHAWSLYM